MKIPTFDEVQLLQLPEGSYSVYSSLNGVYTDMWEAYYSTATLTIGHWEVHGNKTRIHRYKSVFKVRVYKANFLRVKQLLSLAKLLSVCNSVDTSSLGALSRADDWVHLEHLLQNSAEVLDNEYV
jgi:hypothetical protein